MMTFCHTDMQICLRGQWRPLEGILRNSRCWLSRVEHQCNEKQLSKEIRRVFTKYHGSYLRSQYSNRGQSPTRKFAIGEIRTNKENIAENDFYESWLAINWKSNKTFKCILSPKIRKMFLSLFRFKNYIEKEAADFQEAWFSLKGLDDF